MSIFNYDFTRGTPSECGRLETDDRYHRDALEDLKHGIDLIFELKERMNRLHPIASETLVRMLSY